MALVDVHADGDPFTKISLRDSVYAALAEDAVTYALTLLIAGLELIDPLRTALVTLGLLALIVAALLCGLLLLALLALGVLLLLVALLPLRTLGLLTLLALNGLLLLALISLYALLLIPLAALGALYILFALPLDTLRTLDGTPLDRSALRRALSPRLAALNARCRLLRGGPLGRCFARGGRSAATASATWASIVILCLRKARARGGA